MVFGRNGILATFASVTIFGTLSRAAVPSEIEAASRLIGANLVDQIDFNEGQSTLTEEAKAEIRELVRVAGTKGKITEIKVAAWADKDYETDRDKPSKTDRTLSGDRAQAVKNYLKSNLAIANVNDYNMSERPNPLQKLIPVKSEDGSGYIFTRVQKSSAVIMIYLE